MITPSWVVQTLLVGGLLSLAAMAASRVEAWLRRPQRWVWVAVMGLSIAGPVAGSLRRGGKLPVT